MIGYAAPDLATLDHIEGLLEGYGNARLRPSAAALARMRRAVIADARVVRRRWAVEVPKAPRAAGFGLPRPRPRAGVFAVGFAAVLTVALSAAVLAAQPGSPLYDARLYLQTLAAELAPQSVSATPVEPPTPAGQDEVANTIDKAGTGGGGGKGSGAGNGNGGNGKGAGAGNGGGSNANDGGGSGAGNGNTGGNDVGGDADEVDTNADATWDWDNIDWENIDWDQVDWNWDDIDWDQVDWDWDDIDWDWD